MTTFRKTQASGRCLGERSKQRRLLGREEMEQGREKEKRAMRRKGQTKEGDRNLLRLKTPPDLVSVPHLGSSLLPYT